MLNNSASKKPNWLMFLTYCVKAFITVGGGITTAIRPVAGMSLSSSGVYFASRGEVIPKKARTMTSTRKR